MTGVKGEAVTAHAGSVDAPDFVVVDVETSCSLISSICQIGIVGFKDGRETFAYETLLDPRDRFSSFNTRIHGITSDHVMGSPTFADVHAVVAAHMSGRVAVAHSLFDKGALAAACLIHRRDPIDATWLDSVRVARRAWPDLPSHRLNVLTHFLELPHKHHDALSDARAAGMVIVRAIEHTGMDLAGWLAPNNPRRSKAPPPAPNGPLKGERIVILGAARDGRLARTLAAGARASWPLSVRPRPGWSSAMTNPSVVSSPRMPSIAKRRRCGVRARALRSPRRPKWVASLALVIVLRSALRTYERMTEGGERAG